MLPSSSGNPTKNLCGHDAAAGLKIERALPYRTRQKLQMYSHRSSLSLFLTEYDCMHHRSDSHEQDRFGVTLRCSFWKHRSQSTDLPCLRIHSHITSHLSMGMLTSGILNFCQCPSKYIKLKFQAMPIEPSPSKRRVNLSVIQVQQRTEMLWYLKAMEHNQSYTARFTKKNLLFRDLPRGSQVPSKQWHRLDFRQNFHMHFRDVGLRSGLLEFLIR